MKLSMVKLGLIAMLITLWSACGSSRGNQSNLQTLQPKKSGFTQVVSATGTLDVLGPTPTIAGLLPPLVDENCIPVSEAGGQIGQTVCLKGTIAKAHQSDNGYIISFDETPDSFVLVIPDAYTANQKAGQCILVKGKIVSTSGHPQIFLGNTDQLQYCR